MRRIQYAEGVKRSDPDLRRRVVERQLFERCRGGTDLTSSQAAHREVADPRIIVLERPAERLRGGEVVGFCGGMGSRGPVARRFAGDCG